MKTGSFQNVFGVYNNNNKSKVNNNVTYPNLSPLKKDTVSFGASTNETKKSDELLPAEIRKKVADMKNEGDTADLTNWI